MNSETVSEELVKSCNCGCRCCLINHGFCKDWSRAVKRKYDELEADYQLSIPGFDHSTVARVQVENECEALRETVISQQQSIQDLYLELEEERNASASATDETMEMILRVQKEKADIQMEARQFKRFVEEKMSHDQQELLALEDMLYKREEIIQSLTFEVQAYKHRMMSYGSTEDDRNSNQIMFGDEEQFELPMHDYPPLKCTINETHDVSEMNNEVEDVEKYAFGETPRDQEDLKNLEYRISQMETGSSSNQIDGDSPVAKSIPECTSESPKMEYTSQMEDNSTLIETDNESENGDDMSDRVYTIDSVHTKVPNHDVIEPNAAVGIDEDPEIKKLHMRLQALEADRESMKQAIVSMGTDKAQLVLLKEIAQQLCRERTPERRMPVEKPSLLGSFSFLSIFKWTVSFILWKKKARYNKYGYGLSAKNAGLLMLLDNGPRVRHLRCLNKHASMKPNMIH